MKGRLQIETVASLVLKDNPLGDPRRREIPVYLPPSHGKVRGRTYPVLYYFPGFTGTGRAAVNVSPWKENVAERFDRLISTGRSKEAILVIVDGFTAFGGSQYLNSSATGRYEDFIADELVAFIDDKFATRRGPNGRAVVGKSSGGFGALSLAMRRPGLFGHVACHSGDMGFDQCYLRDIPAFIAAYERNGGSLKKMVDAFLKSHTKEEFPHGAINLMAMAACYSPDRKSPVCFSLPFDPATGELIPAIWRRWLAFDPIHAAARHARALRRLKTLWFDAGTKDEFALHLGARRFSRTLKLLGVRHIHEEHARGHFDMAERLDVSLPLLAARSSL